MILPFQFEHPVLLAWLVLLPVVLLVLRFTLVDSPRVQKGLSACVRVCVLALIVLALGGALWVSKSTGVAIVVLGDLSASTPKSAAEQLQGFLQAFEDRVQNPERAGLVLFSAAVNGVYPIQHYPDFPDTLSIPEERSDTHIADALLMAREMLPSGAVKRVVLMSDGNETLGDGIQAAKLLRRHGISIYTMPYESDADPEVLLEDLTVPAEVKKGQSFTIGAAAHAEQETSATFALYRNGFKIEEREMDLEPGVNRLVFEEPNPDDGLTKYELRVRAQDDFFVDNNLASGIVYVAGEPRVLLLEGDEREGRYLSRALEAENIHVDLREGKGVPASLDELAAFDAVIMSDVPATDLSVPQMELMRTYIEDLGGGFIMVGGEESFGVGGYYRTPIEESLPVRMKSEKKKDTPSLAMMVIVDKSGSMDGVKIELAKEAAIATVELLSDRDYVGVVAFDSSPYWVVDLQSAGARAGIVQTLSTLDAGGGTSIYPAMVEGHEALRNIPATFKHVVLLTDGQSQEGDFAGITDQMVNDLITVSTVAVGEGADTVLLQDIARWGRGRYYFTADPYDIPQIFTKETMKASKSSLIEEPFLAQVFQSNQVIQSIDWNAAPFLFGYVVTTPKSTAAVSLVTERGDPLLTVWQYGLGKTAAFTSDAKSRWASDWLGWQGYGTFWAQLVRDVMRTTQHRGTETTIAFRGNAGSIVVDNVDESGNFVNGLTTKVQVIQPDLSIVEHTLAQTGPGRYETTIPMEDTGSYLLRIRQTVPSPEGPDADPVEVSNYTRGVTVSYKPEYRHLNTNEEYLQALATITNGTYKPELDDLFAVSEDQAVPVRNRLWPWLLAAALLLFVLDVALRRMDLAGFRLFSTPQRYG